MGISSPVLSRPRFVLERKSQRGDCGIALRGGAVVGRLWARLKSKPAIRPPLKLLEITGESFLRGLQEARNLKAHGLPVARH